MDSVVLAEATEDGRLRQFFTSHPWLEDATICGLNVLREARQVEMVLEAADFEEGGDEVRTRFRLTWTGVTTFDFPLGAEDLFRVEFQRAGERLETTLEAWPGVFGTVVSDRVEAVLLPLASDHDVPRSWLRVF